MSNIDSLVTVRHPQYVDRPKHRAAHGNASPRTIERRMELENNLPEGSVKIIYPSGRRAYYTTTIESIRKAWNIFYGY